MDFDVKMNIMNLIVPEDEKRKMNYVKIMGPGELGFRGEARPTTLPQLAGLEDWARRYCEDASAIKQ